MNTIKKKKWSYKRWCEYLDKRTGWVIHRGRAEKYYKGDLTPSEVLCRPLVLQYIIPQYI